MLLQAWALFLLLANAFCSEIALPDKLEQRVPRGGPLCSSLNNDCQNIQGHLAYRYCSSFLEIPNGPSRTTKTIATATFTTSTTITRSVKQCQPAGPMKRDLLFNERAASSSGSVPLPTCMTPFTSQRSILTSACNCFDYPITTSVVTNTQRHGQVTRTLTSTMTSVTVAPKCTPTSDSQTWKPFYRYCRAFRNPLDSIKAIYYDSNVPLCTVLQMCVEDPAAQNASSLAMTWHAYPGEDPQWECFLYTSNASVGLTQIRLAPQWSENYGYAIP